MSSVSRVELALGVAGRRLAAGDVEAALERLERGDQAVQVQRRRAADPDRGHDRREVGDDLALLGLLVGDQQQRRVDLGDASAACGTPPACVRSSSSVSALDSAAKPERPEVARIFFSHTTDSVPSAWRLSRL